MTNPADLARAGHSKEAFEAILADEKTAGAADLVRAGSSKEAFEAILAGKSETETKVEDALKKTKLKPATKRFAPNGAGAVVFEDSKFTTGGGGVQAEKDAKALKKLLDKAGLKTDLTEMKSVGKWRVNIKAASDHTAGSMRHVTDITKGISDIILRHSKDSKVEKEVVQMLLRFKSDLDRRGFRVRDPQAFAEDLLYAFDVSPEVDLSKAKAIFNEYVEGADSSDL